MRPYTLAGLVLIVGIAAALPFRHPRPAGVAVPSPTAAADGEPAASTPSALAVEPLEPPPPAELVPQPLAIPDADLPALDSGYGEVAVPLATPRVALDSRLLSAADAPGQRSVAERAGRESQANDLPEPPPTVSLEATASSPDAAAGRSPAETSDPDARPRLSAATEGAPTEGAPNARFRTGLPLLEIEPDSLPPPVADAPEHRLVARPASTPSETKSHRASAPPAPEAATAQDSELPAPRPRYFIREPER